MRLKADGGSCKPQNQKFSSDGVGLPLRLGRLAKTAMPGAPRLRVTLQIKIVLITVSFFLLAVGANTAISNYIFKHDYFEALLAKGVLVGQMLKVELARLLDFGVNAHELVGFEEQCREAVFKYQVSFAAVIAADGKIIFHNLQSRQGRKVRDRKVLQAIRRAGAGVEQVVLDSRRALYHIIIPIIGMKPQADFMVMVGLPLEVVTKKNNELVFYSIYFAVLTFAVSVVLYYLIVATWVTRPVKNLIDTIKKIRTDNDLSSRVAVRSDDEIGILGAAFNRLLEEINCSRGAILKQNQQLEQQVAERTVRLREINELLERDIIKRQSAEIELAKRAEKLANSNAELRQFAYVTSHDLKEPLRVISSYLQLLRRRYQTKLDQKALEYIAIAVDGANRMHRLIDDILDLSRVGACDFEFEAVDFRQVVQQVVTNLEVMIAESGVKISWDDLPEVYADFSQLIRLLQNLVGNAIKFRSRTAPEIRIEARRVAEAWRFAVRDNGIGIASTDLERIFLIFQRLHTRFEYSGTGIGLAICKKIVERHGGVIWAESELGKGAIFYFTIPDCELPKNLETTRG
jgi:signal transduction histidine kinase